MSSSVSKKTAYVVAGTDPETETRSGAEARREDSDEAEFTDLVTPG